jgi:tRNA threonylcarbamoyl adenosine modification protein YjeE
VCQPVSVVAADVSGLGRGEPILLVGRDATAELAAAVAASIRTGDTILLVGDLGAGKTTFVQALAVAMGATDDVVSPTFTIMRHVPLADGRTLLHLDAYRLHGPDDLDDLGFFELLEGDAIAVIEWGDIVADAFMMGGSRVIRIELDTVPTDPDARLARIVGLD